LNLAFHTLQANARCHKSRFSEVNFSLPEKKQQLSSESDYFRIEVDPDFLERQHTSGLCF